MKKSLLLVLVALLLIAMAVIVLRRFGFAPIPDAAAIAANNRGVGLLGKYENEAARAEFQALVDRYPDWEQARINLAIALLNRQQEGDSEAALAMLEQVIAQRPDNLQAQYCSGLLKLYLQSPQDALRHFETVAQADPDDAYAAYYVGQCQAQVQQYEEAVRWYERALDADPYLRSAYYALSQAYQRVNEEDKATEMIEQFTRLADNPRARLVEFMYTKMGPKGMARAADRAPIEPAPAPDGAIFADAVALPLDGPLPAGVTWAGASPSAPKTSSILSSGERAAGVAAADLNLDGAIDVVVTRALRRDGMLLPAVLLNRGDGTFRLEAEHPIAQVAEVNAVLLGDIDNDRLIDAYLCCTGPNQLWRQRDEESWERVDAEAIDGGDRDTVDGAMVDADHDGDLDIFCVNADGSNELINNNRDGTFRTLALAQGIDGGQRGSRQVCMADLDRDRDLDIVVVNDQPPHSIFLNDRLWQYQPAGPAFDALKEADVVALVAGDVDADGMTEIYTLDSAGSVFRFAPDAAGDWRPKELIPFAGPPFAVVKLVLADLRGDGRLELALIGGDVVTVLEVGESGAAPIQSALSTSPSFRFYPGGSGLLLLDPAQGPGLLTVKDGGPPEWWGPGPGRYPFVALSFTGAEDAGNSMRSNASGIGTHVAIRSGSLWTVTSTLRNDSGPGQGHQPLSVGLGGFEQIDFVAIDWSDGVFQSEIDLKSGRLHEIPETQRQISSCPVVFVWDGERHRFVSDVLGVGGIGFAVGPGEYATPRPWERFLFPPGVVAARGQRYEIKIGEPMEEAMYLDAARLVAYDLPPGWSMALDERMSILGPGPTGAPRYFRRSVRPDVAVNGRGEDVTAAIAMPDLQAADPGALDLRFIGRLADDHRLTLMFDPPITAAGARPILIADGWIEYPYSQTMFSAWQAGADYRAPTIEAQSPDGRWRTILEQFGYPAGMPRTMSVPLTDLPGVTTALRVTTNQEIYWDWFAVAMVEECPDAVVRECRLERAEVRRSGFAHRPRLPQRLPFYDYDRRSPVWDTRHQAGRYTRFGEAGELVAEVDDGLAIIGPGEEVHLEFAAMLPQLPAGWTRRFVLEVEGWCKDMDLYTKDGETLTPLPASGPPSTAVEALHRTYNTRYRDGY